MIHNVESLKVEVHHKRQYYRISVANYPSVHGEIDHFSSVNPTDMIRNKKIKEIQRYQIEGKINETLLDQLGEPMEGSYGIKDVEGRYSLHVHLNHNTALLKYTPPPAEYDYNYTHCQELTLFNTDIPGEFTCPDFEGLIFNIMLDVTGGRRKTKKTCKHKKRRKSRNIFSLF